MGDGSKAFVKGGAGCLVAFLGIGLVVAVLGGHVTLDCGGAVILFGIGGLIGLVFLAIYKKGYREGRSDLPPRTPSAWTCLACGSDNPGAAKLCQVCHEPR
jgi:hypothetical protein